MEVLEGDEGHPIPPLGREDAILDHEAPQGDFLPMGQVGHGGRGGCGEPADGLGVGGQRVARYVEP